MLLRVALFLMMAVGIAGAGATAWIMFEPPAAPPAVGPAPEPPAVKTSVIVAAHGLRAGSLIKQEDLVARDMAAADVPTGASRDTPQIRSSLTGSMIRRSLGESQIIMPEDVVHPGDHGFLAAVLGPNMRAITVAVDVVSGTAGLIWPGDRVDLILTQSMDDPNLAAGRRVAAETVLTDARVIAVDQQMVHGQAPDGSVAPANRTATLEVTGPQAERVLVAGRLGKLSLSVLSADRHMDGSEVATAEAPPAGKQTSSPPMPGTAPGATAAGKRTTGVTWASDVSPALGSGDVRNTPALVRIFQGGSDSKDYHF